MYVITYFQIWFFFVIDLKKDCQLTNVFELWVYRQVINNTKCWNEKPENKMQITKINHSRKFKQNFYISTIVSTKYLHLSKNTFSTWCSRCISTCFFYWKTYIYCFKLTLVLFNLKLKFSLLNVSFKLDFHLQTKLSVWILLFGIRRACWWLVLMFLYRAPLVSST